MSRADLHIHSTASDGWLSPSDVVGIASALGLNYIALCDHDTVDGVPVALAASNRYNDMTVIPSVELSTDYGDRDVHLLGCWVDVEDATLRTHLNEYARASTRRIEEMAHKLTFDGFPVTRKDLIAVADGGMWRRPHLARVLVMKGYATDIEDAFTRFIGDDAPYFKKYHHMSTKEGIDLITEAGGFPFVAHPGISNLFDRLGEIVTLGLKGIEAFHSRHTEDQAACALEAAQRYDLLVSGGSDWHGDETNGIVFGTPMLPEPYLDRFLAANPRQLPSLR